MLLQNAGACFNSKEEEEIERQRKIVILYISTSYENKSLLMKFLNTATFRHIHELHLHIGSISTLPVLARLVLDTNVYHWANQHKVNLLHTFTFGMLVFIRYDCVGTFSYSTSGHNLFGKSYHLHVLMEESMPYYVLLINDILLLHSK